MKKKGLSMNLIMALTLTAVAVSVLLCANLVFMQTYRRTLLRNAETTSRQAIAQAGSTMNEYLENMDDAVTLLTGYLELPAEEREARFEAFLEIRADVVAVTTYDAEGEMRNCYSLGRRLREDILQNLSFDPDKRELYEGGYISGTPRHVDFRGGLPMGRDHYPPCHHRRGGAVHRRGRELLQHLHLYQRRGHRPAGLLLPGRHGGESGLPSPAAAHLFRSEKREYRADRLPPRRDACGGKHHLHRPDPGKRHLAGGGRQLVSGADHRRPGGRSCASPSSARCLF